MEVRFFSDADAVATDQLQSEGFEEARRLWVLSIRGKINGRLTETSTSGRALWMIWRQGQDALDVWVRTDQTEALFAQIQREFDKTPETWHGGFPGATTTQSNWGEIRPEGRALILGRGGQAWLAQLNRIRASVADLTQEELDADPNGGPVGSWRERP
jgi:hypothetical protein